MWHMPLFFLISGSAAYFALAFRKAGEYLRERVTRLFVPLIFGILTYIPLTTYIQRIGSISFPKAYLGFFQFDFARLDGMNGTFTPAHLWFILYLFVFSVIAVPIFLFLRSEGGKKVIQKSGDWIPAPISLLLFGLLLTLTAALNILGDKNPLYYFLVFLAGYLIASDPRFQTAIDNLVWGNLAFGIVAAVVQMATYYKYTEWTAPWILRGLLYEFGRWALTLAALGIGHRYLNHTSSFLRYSNKAAMPFYLLHMTFTVLAGYFVVKLDLPVAVKYPLIILAATALTLLASELVSRWKVTRWLFGMRAGK
jgi:fucose 4-O-acetylase-like acetyltransferase